MAAHSQAGKGFEPQLTPTQLRAWISYLEGKVSAMERVCDAASRFVHAAPRQLLVSKGELCRATMAFEEASKATFLPNPTPEQQAEAAAWAMDV